jgi:hypothetical protein
MTTAAHNALIQTPGTGTSSNDMGAYDMVNANFKLQQAFINMLSFISAVITAISEFTNASSQSGVTTNNNYWAQYMAKLDAEATSQGSKWTPTPQENEEMTAYQSKTQQENALVSEVNQSVSTISSAYTNLMSAEQGNSSNMNTMTGDVIDTLLASMRLQS